MFFIFRKKKIDSKKCKWVNSYKERKALKYLTWARVPSGAGAFKSEGTPCPSLALTGSGKRRELSILLWNGVGQSRGSVGQSEWATVGHPLPRSSGALPSFLPSITSFSLFHFPNIYIYIFFPLKILFHFINRIFLKIHPLYTVCPSIFFSFYFLLIPFPT